MEPRICPVCERKLRWREGKHLCWSCWVLYDLEETLPHPHLEDLCVFEVSDCGAGRWYTCAKCGKAILISWEEEKEYAKLFDREYVEKRRKENEERDERIKETIYFLECVEYAKFVEWLGAGTH